MATENASPEDFEPLLISSNQSVVNQKAVLNLNNRRIRLTLWCLLYVVLTTAEMSYNLGSLIYYDYIVRNVDDDGSVGFLGWRQFSSIVTYYLLSLSTDCVLALAAAMLLWSWYCSCCKMQRNCIKVASILFLVGSIMEFTTMTYGSQAYTCHDFYNWYLDMNVEKSYCHALLVGSSIFLALLSFCIAIDIVKSFGNNIFVRVFVISLLISVRSFLIFAYWQHRWTELNKLQFEHPLDVGYEILLSFQNVVLSVSNAICGIITSIITIILLRSYVQNAKKIKINSCVLRFLSYVLLCAVGCTMSFGMGVFGPVQSVYYGAAAVMLVYDLKYL